MSTKDVPCAIDDGYDPRLLGYVSAALVSLCLIFSNIFFLIQSRKLKYPSDRRNDKRDHARSEPAGE
ncbi:hypothetical protein GCK32_007802 [Trichostrongylus colubriformis]|uniref:Uncharacterized protein n=1 Tax=Trichostrongylus colubriformis TaxID=6319 RepID=A0AAN8IFC2_TRICO